MTQRRPTELFHEFDPTSYAVLAADLTSLLNMALHVVEHWTADEALAALKLAHMVPDFDAFHFVVIDWPNHLNVRWGQLSDSWLDLDQRTNEDRGYVRNQPSPSK